MLNLERGRIYTSSGTSPGRGGFAVRTEQCSVPTILRNLKFQINRFTVNEGETRFRKNRATNTKCRLRRVDTTVFFV